MCGLLGEVAFGNQISNQENFKDLLYLSSSRGPDETRIEIIGTKLCFGFNRLSVIDPSHYSSQPIWTPSKRYLIVFNGEIYNHLDLRNKLYKNGKNIKGHGDTVTLSSCIDEWGIIKTVSQLDGMFAIGIWDKLKNTISLIRDFAGIKPLYYGYNKNLLVFASQYNQISRHPAFLNKKIDNRVLKLYLMQHFIPSPFGLLEDTYSVAPGQIITFNSGGKRDSIFYWEYPKYEQINLQEEFALETVRNEIELAVKAELISDRPLGSFLSGGVDSPLICFYAQSKLVDQLKTFSIGTESVKHDESILSKEYANFLHTKHYSKKMNADNSLYDLEKIVASAGEPLGDFSLIPTWEVSKFSSKRVTVALSGDGADELFFGYDRFRSIAKNHWLWASPYGFRYLIRGLDKLFFNEKHTNECVLSTHPSDAHFGLHNHYPINMLKKILPNIINYRLPSNFDIFDYKRPKSQEELLYHIRRAEFYGMLQKTLLKVDRASMAHSLEVRVPFLKKTVIEAVCSLGISVHEPMKTRKKLLYKLLQSNFPTIEHEKQKKGFSIPLAQWIRTSYKDMFYDALLEKNFYENFGMDRLELEKIIDTHVKGHLDLKWLLFNLYSLSIWNKYQIRKN